MRNLWIILIIMVRLCKMHITHTYLPRHDKATRYLSGHLIYDTENVDGTLDWEQSLREATVQAFAREHLRDPDLRERIHTAPLLGKHKLVPSFGDIILVARGQIYVNNDGYLFVQDQMTCVICPDRSISSNCDSSRTCQVWRPKNEELLALWSVKRIRHRSTKTRHNIFNLEIIIAPVDVRNSQNYLTAEGSFNYDIPGHIFTSRAFEYHRNLDIGDRTYKKNWDIRQTSNVERFPIQKLPVVLSTETIRDSASLKEQLTLPTLTTKTQTTATKKPPTMSFKPTMATTRKEIMQKLTEATSVLVEKHKETTHPSSYSLPLSNKNIILNLNPAASQTFEKPQATTAKHTILANFYTISPINLFISAPTINKLAPEIINNYTNSIRGYYITTMGYSKEHGKDIVGATTKKVQETTTKTFHPIFENEMSHTTVTHVTAPYTNIQPGSTSRRETLGTTTEKSKIATKVTNTKPMRHTKPMFIGTHSTTTEKSKFATKVTNTEHVRYTKPMFTTTLSTTTEKPKFASKVTNTEPSRFTTPMFINTHSTTTKMSNVPTKVTNTEPIRYTKPMFITESPTHTTVQTSSEKETTVTVQLTTSQQFKTTVNSEEELFEKTTLVGTLLSVQTPTITESTRTVYITKPLSTSEATYPTVTSNLSGFTNTTTTHYESTENQQEPMTTKITKPSLELSTHFQFTEGETTIKTATAPNRFDLAEQTTVITSAEPTITEPYSVFDEFTTFKERTATATLPTQASFKPTTPTTFSSTGSSSIKTSTSTRKPFNTLQSDFLVDSGQNQEDTKPSFVNKPYKDYNDDDIFGPKQYLPPAFMKQPTPVKKPFKLSQSEVDKALFDDNNNRRRKSLQAMASMPNGVTITQISPTFVMATVLTPAEAKIEKTTAQTRRRPSFSVSGRPVTALTKLQKNKVTETAVTSQSYLTSISYEVNKINKDIIDIPQDKSGSDELFALNNDGTTKPRRVKYKRKRTYVSTIKKLNKRV